MRLPIKIKIHKSLMIGDTVIFLLFSWIGRWTHHLPIDMKSTLFTAFPFILTWFIISPFFGLFHDDQIKSFKQSLWRTILAVPITTAAGVWLRAILVHHPLYWLFYWASLLFLLPIFLIWRSLYAWLCSRKSS
jgi:Protein of unknown function (DUF3054)